jgi:hypothetical protein
MKTAATVTIGDRESPLEADPETDVVRLGPLIGDRCEISPFVGGGLVSHVGKRAEIKGVIKRLGLTVGYEISIDGKTDYVTLKDVYVNRQFLEDVQPATALTVAIREALSHWSKQRDYWSLELLGLESLCYELATVVPAVHIAVHENGWVFTVPELLGGCVVVDCAVRPHGNVWSLTVAVYPDRKPCPPVTPIKDHWARVFTWTHSIANRAKNLPWGKAVKNLELRAKITAKVLRPLLAQSLHEALSKSHALFGEAPVVLNNGVSIGMSKVRLKPMTVGLTEQPSERRPYTVLSISPDVCRDRKLLRHVVAHECVHLAVAVRGGDPHNGDFKRLADSLGIPEGYQG